MRSRESPSTPNPNNHNKPSLTSQTDLFAPLRETCFSLSDLITKAGMKKWCSTAFIGLQQSKPDPKNETEGLR